MASQRAMLSYWNGSAWTNVVMAGTTTTALVGVSIEDILGNPQTGSFRVANESLNPYAGSGSAKGPYSGVFTDFMPVRVIDEETESIIFYGLVYNVSETYEKQYGMVLDLTCKDYMIELRDNTTDGDYGYKVDISAAATSVSVTNFAESNKDIKQKTWSTVLSSRGGIIKSLITKTTDNLTFASDTARFVESVRKFAKDTTYRLGDRNNKSILAHIASLSAADPHNASGEQLFGYDYYVDPNFTATATSHKPTAFFNYFKRATRPNAAPATYGLSIQQPSSGGFTPTGQLQAMLDFDFERPKSEIYTHATGKFPFTATSADGSTSTGTMSMNFEVLQIKAQTNLNSFRAGPVNNTNLPLASPELAHGVDRGVTTNDPPEWMRVKLDGSGDYDESSGTLTTIARIQYINKTASETISDGDPAYVIISEVDESINDTAWADGVIWHGKTNTSSNFTIKSRPKVKYGVSRGTKIEMGSDNTPDSIRENIASALIRRSNQIVRGNFKVFEKPRFYVETYAAAHNPDGDNVNEITLNIDAYDYGLRAGMVLAKVDANGTQTAYGYVSSVEDTTKKVVVTLNSGTFSGYTGSSNKLRFYVPVRAGDVISVRNDLVNVSGIFLVTKVRYTEQPGVTNTQYDVVGQEDLTVGGGVRRTLAARTADRSNQSMNLPMLHPQAMAMANALISCVFSSTTDGTVVDADGVHWAAGTLAVGIDAYTIDSGTTITTMVASGDGNTGQSGTALATDVDYYIFYPGTGTALKTIRKANYANVVTEDTMLIAQCKAGTTRAEFHLFTSTFVNTPTDGATENSLSTVLVKKGIQAWSSNIDFIATGTTGEYNKIKFGQKGSIASNATVSFSDNSTEAIAHSATGTSSLGNSSSVAGGKVTLATGVNYIYKAIGDSAATTLVITNDYTAVYQDDRILLCMVLVNGSDDGSDSPSIFPFTGNEGTISAGVISAGAITAAKIQANAIDAKTITLTGGGKFLTSAGAVRNGTNHNLSTNFSSPASGILIDQYGIIGASGTGSGNVQFYLSAADGKAVFGNNAIMASIDGLTLASTGVATANKDTNIELGSQKTIRFSTGADKAAALSATPKVELGMEFITSSTTPASAGGASFAVMQWALPDYDTAAYFVLQDMNRGVINNLSSLGPGDLNEQNHIRLPSDMHTIAPYETGTASQSGNTITGSGTTWTTAMIGSTFSFDSGGGGGTVTARASNTSITVNTSATVASGTYHMNLKHPSLHPLLFLQDDGSTDGYPDTPWGLSVMTQDDLIGSLEFATPPSASGYGMFRHTTDGGGGSSDVTAFNAGQSSSVPATGTANSSFWTMLSEGDGSTGSRLIFEPIIDWASDRNLSYIGYHNALTGVNSYYLNAGQGTEAFPSHTFYGDQDTGMYSRTANNLFFATGGADRVIINSTALYPADDDDLDLGWSGGGENNRWDNVYATNGTIQTSDKREKTNITPTLLGLDFINDLNPVSYKWKKKPQRPMHYGLIAQEVLETLKEHGIESRDEFGGITGDEKGLYGAKYEEFTAILIKAVQELSEKVKKLEEGK